MIPKIGPRQYPISKPQINNEEDSKSKQASAQTQEDGENLQQSKGLAYAEEGRNQTQLPTGEQTRSNLVQTSKPQQEGQYVSKEEQNEEDFHHVTNHNGLCKTNTPLSKRSTKINIAQILKDFKNTAVAIATPDDLMEEVDGYIGLIRKQVEKDKPNVKLIQSNLKNAGGLLDKYISDTLNKDSKVVQNWVEAVFLQDVNYKYDDEEINVDFLVNFPENTKKEEKPKETAEAQPQPQVVEDKDKDLKEKFIKAKKEGSIEQFREALTLTDNAEDKEIKIRFNPNSDRPSVVITDPEVTTEGVLKSGNVTISGTATDNEGIKAVYVQIAKSGDTTFAENNLIGGDNCNGSREMIKILI